MGFRVDRRCVELSKRVPIAIQDTLSFIEDEDFLREFYECGLTDDDLEKLQIVITVNPTGGRVVPVTKSIRDAFYRIDDREMVVIRYVYLEPANTVLLLAAYWGTDSLSMTRAEADLAECYVERQLKYLSRRYTK